MTKPKLFYFGHITRRLGSLDRTIMLGTIEGSRTRGRSDVRWTGSITEATGMESTGAEQGC